MEQLLNAISGDTQWIPARNKLGPKNPMTGMSIMDWEVCSSGPFDSAGLSVAGEQRTPRLGRSLHVR
jgi:hypothetical protein